LIDITTQSNEIIQTCRRLSERGYIFGTWGNISVRLNDGNILLTPSKVAYDEMTVADMVVLSPEGKQISGTRLATSERELHRGIMNKRPDVQAIIHTHSAYAMAAAAIEGGIPVLSEEMCQLIGGAIPLTGQFVPSENHLELGKEVSEAIGETNAVLIRNHGIVCCGTTLLEAEVCCQVAEKSAQMYLTLLGSNRQMNVLEEPYISMGRNYYTKKYGVT